MRNRIGSRSILHRLGRPTLLLLLIFASLYLVDFLRRTDLLAVREIVVEGTSTQKSEVEDYLADLRDRNLLSAPLPLYEERLRMLPRIKRVRIRKVLPHRIVCQVDERRPVALVFAGSFFEVDDEGMVMPSDSLTHLLDLPVVTGVPPVDIKPGKICSNERLQRALEALRVSTLYGGEIASPIWQVEVDSKGVAIFCGEERLVILLGEGRYEEKLKKLFLLQDTIVRKREGRKVIDLRFQGQVVLRNSL